MLEAVASKVYEIIDAERLRSLTSQPDSDEAVLLELYHLATLVYTNRILEDISGLPRNLDTILDRSFELLSQIEYCPRFFLLFILGTEARTDERRKLMFDLIIRTERRAKVGKMVCLRFGLRTAWVQDDLHADDEVVLKYTHKISAVCSAGRTLPSVV